MEMHCLWMVLPNSFSLLLAKIKLRPHHCWSEYLSLIFLKLTQSVTTLRTSIHSNFQDSLSPRPINIVSLLHGQLKNHLHYSINFLKIYQSGLTLTEWVLKKKQLSQWLAYHWEFESSQLNPFHFHINFLELHSLTLTGKNFTKIIRYCRDCLSWWWLQNHPAYLPCVPEKLAQKTTDKYGAV